MAGSGTLNYLPKWTPNNSTLGNSSIFDNGNVGIGTTSPQATLEVKNGSVLFDGTSGGTPVNGPGKRMMWITGKGAFRAGEAGGSGAWNDASIGFYSVAFGISTKASGWISSAFGGGTIASGSTSTAFGVSTIASGGGSTAFGFSNSASGIGSFVAGKLSTATGDYSSAFGYNSIAQSYNSFVIGQYNIVSGTSPGWVATDPLFVIGNGGLSGPKTGLLIRNNALTVLKNGNVGITTATPKNKLDVQGGIAIGSSYAGVKIAPANGAIIKGNVGIGTPTPTAKMHIKTSGTIGTGIISEVNQNLNKTFIGGITTGSSFTENFVVYGDGHVFARDIKVKLGSLAHPDYVFEDNYKLRTLTELETFLKETHHLPNMPSACEVAENEGINLGEMSEKQLQKIEERTLYIIEMNKKMAELQTRIELQQQEIQTIQNK